MLRSVPADIRLALRPNEDLRRSGCRRRRFLQAQLPTLDRLHETQKGPSLHSRTEANNRVTTGARLRRLTRSSFQRPPQSREACNRGDSCLPHCVSQLQRHIDDGSDSHDDGRSNGTPGIGGREDRHDRDSRADRGRSRDPSLVPGDCEQEASRDPPGRRSRFQ